jgi:hypothetical protein
VDGVHAHGHSMCQARARGLQQEVQAAGYALVSGVHIGGVVLGWA